MKKKLTLKKYKMYNASSLDREEAMEDMGFSTTERIFKTGNFEGPLDLLLFLVNEKKMNILDINLLFIADQYVDIVMKSLDLDLDQASEYLLIASKLLTIKTRAILNLQLEEEKVIDSDEENLIDSLIKYEKIKVVSHEIEEIFDSLVLMDKDEDDLDYLLSDEQYNQVFIRNNQEDLSATLKELISKNIILEKIAKQPTITRRKISIEQVINFIINRCEIGEVFFSKLIQEKDRMYISILFLALLELVSKKILIVEEIKGDILIRANK